MLVTLPRDVRRLVPDYHRSCCKFKSVFAIIE